MKTKQIHTSNISRFSRGISADVHGYAILHDSPRYAAATSEQLTEWTESRVKAVRNAAAVELADRAVAEWQKTNA